MFIQNPYRYGEATNTFIGGVGATSVTSVSDFIALTTGITSDNISNMDEVSIFDIELTQTHIDHIFAKNSDGLALTE